MRVRAAWKRGGTALALSGLSAAALGGGMARAQTNGGQQGSSTTVGSNSTSLQLPGALQLTGTVTSAGTAGGLATGTVTFSSDGNALGTAPLTALPATWSLPGSAVESDIGTDLGSFVAVDLYGTGLPVLLVGSSVFPYQGLSQTGDVVTLYYNNGSGTFAASGDAPTGLTVDEIQDQPDAAVAGYFVSQSAQSAVFHTPGMYYTLASASPNGIAVIHSSYGYDSGPANYEQLIAADFDGDGYSDLGALDFDYDNNATVTLAINTSDGGYGSFLNSNPASFAEESFCPVAIVAGKFDAALATPQVAVLGYDASPCTYGANNQGQQSYIALYSYDPVLNGLQLLPQGEQSVGFGQTAVTAADLNGDGKLDLIVAGYGTETGVSADVQVFLGDGTGGFAANPISTTALPSTPQSLVVGDFNGDGKQDVATLGSVYSSGEALVLLGDGTGALSSQTFGLDFPNTSLAVADVNHDGLPDLISLSDFNEGDRILEVLLSTETAQASFTTPNQSLPAGNHNLTASYGGDANFLPSTSGAFPVTVTQSPTTASWPTPAPIPYGTPVSAAQLDATASVPGTFTYTANGTTLVAGQTVLPVGTYMALATFVPTDAFDYAGTTATTTLQVTGSLSGVALLNANGQPASTVNPGDQVGVQITVGSNSVQQTATVTLAFADQSANPASSNGSLLFANVPAGDMLNASSTTDTFTIPAGTSGTLPLRTVAVGDVTGVVTATVTLTDSTGASEQAAQTTTVEPAVPAIQSVTLTTVSGGLQVAVLGSSSTREISAASFTFTAADGHTIKNPDVSVDPSTEFTTFYTGTASAADGSAFTYTQPFTLNVNPDEIANVTVTLTNSKGTSTATPNQ